MRSSLTLATLNLLARGRQDAQCAPGKSRKMDDGWRGGQAEGQGDEGGGAGDACMATIAIVNLVIKQRRFYSITYTIYG